MKVDLLSRSPPFSPSKEHRGHTPVLPFPPLACPCTGAGQEREGKRRLSVSENVEETGE